MGFLNPLWLLLGAAVAVPLILHLLQRHQGPRVIFPAVRYLQRAEREHARRIRLRQLLLLLLRVAVVLLIAFAAARPFFRGAGVGHEPTAVVLIIDNSLSSGVVTGDRRLLDELKDRALETLARAGSDDRFWLLPGGAPWEPALPGDAATTAARVRELAPTAGSADIVAAVARARTILEQGAAGRAAEIQLLSDLQASNVRGSLAEQRTAASVLLWSPKRAPLTNASVDAVTVGGGLAPRAGERSTVVATVGGNARDSINVRLSIDGRIAAAAITRPGSAVIMPFPARPASLVMGDVQIDADALRADDRRFFVATIAPPPRVAFPAATPFVSEALGVLADAGRIARASGTADVVIAPSGAGAESAGASGSAVIIPPQSPLQLPAVNRRLAVLGIAWRIEQRQGTGELHFAPNSDAGVELARSLTGVRVLQHYRLVPTGTTRQDSIVLRLEDGSPWAVRGVRARGGRFVLFASPFTIEATTLPASAAMIPLFDRATGAWSADDAPRSEAVPGERIALPSHANEIIDHAGARHRVTRSGVFEATEPGVYRVVADGNVIGAFVVNPARNESDLRYADPKRVERVLSPLRVKRAGDASSWQRSMYANRVGREIWRTVLFALLALLIVEAVIAATGGSETRTVEHASAAD